MNGILFSEEDRNVLSCWQYFLTCVFLEWPNILADLTMCVLFLNLWHSKLAAKIELQYIFINLQIKPSSKHDLITYFHYFHYIASTFNHSKQANKMHSFKTVKDQGHGSGHGGGQSNNILSLSSSSISNYNPTTPFITKPPQQSHYKPVVQNYSKMCMTTTFGPFHKDEIIIQHTCPITSSPIISSKHGPLHQQICQRLLY